MADWTLVYEDESLVVVDKAPGLAVLPERWEEGAGSLVDQLQARWPTLATAHRIDKETSGLVLCVLNAEAARALARDFAEREVSKLYRALIQGRLPQPECVCELPLLVDGDRRHRTLVSPRGGVEARTGFVELGRYASWSLVEARLYTGRTHQIRAHATALGCPLVGDTLYGGQALYLSMIKRSYKGDRESERPLVDRVALHATSLEFRHPVTGATMHFDSPWPADLQPALKQLERNAR